MPTCHALLLSALLGVSAVNAFCGDNGGAELGFGTQADTDSNGGNPSTVLGFSASGPFDAAGNPILSVIATNAGFDSSFYAFAAFLCGQANPDSYPQTTFGPVINEDSISTQTNTPLCLTASALGEANITVALLPCINDISVNPVPTQTFQWIGTDFITYGFEFIGNQSGTPLDPSTPTDYIPSLVSVTNGTGAYLRLDYVPGGLPPSTGRETGMVLALSDD
ncbi:hypothetical protein B0H17DRAFT_1128553 [Mycena rosella]|uniref:Uncharacterized protein n=1 Tax=Mycena rosella TaxID=1033263 RepID=A0AAD7GLS0_MYCRO|nr:hypothetical protein B0H17DRAFT_1128553 [Mycena rosella]